MQNLFSEHWHLVKHAKPKLREAIDVFPRRLRGRSWVFLHDQSTQKFLRLTPEAWLIIKLMDGRTDLETLWENSSLHQQRLQAEHQFYTDSEHPAISQHDLVNLLSQLYSNDMLQTQYAADATEMVKRQRKQRFNEFKQAFLNPISLKIPLFYPDAWFSKQRPLALKIYSWGFFTLWLVMVLPAAVLAGSHWQTLTANIPDRILSTSNLFILWCTYPLVKAVHEWGHGMAVKAWGGVVREVGLMFVIFMPVPYVDATYSYRFTSKWVRALVAATGVMAELLLGAIALYVWLNVESGLVRAFAYNVIIIAGVSSLLVNGNPLMRYDGYYVLTDLIEIPNLAQRAKQYWVYLSDKYLFNAQDAKPPMGYQNERFWLFWYGLLSPIYRTFVVFGMIWLVAKQYFIVGIIMALVAAFMSFIVPMYKGVKHIYMGNSLMKVRLQSKRRFYLLLILLLMVLFVVPLPFYSIQQGVAWLPDSQIIKAQTAGTISNEDLPKGQYVSAGQKLAQLTNLDTQQRYANLEQQKQAIVLKQRQAQSEDVAKYPSLIAQYQALQEQQRLLLPETQALTIQAPQAGYWYPKPLNTSTGSYVKKGDIIGYVLPKQTDIVRVIIEQNDINLIEQRLQGIELKSTTELGTSYQATMVRKTPKANFELPLAALGVNAGGNIIIDPSDNTGKKSVERVFDVELQVTPEQNLKQSQPLGFNDRVYVRFDLGNMPIGWQWLIRIRQLFLKNFNV